MAARTARSAASGKGFSYLSVKGAEGRLDQVIQRQRLVHPKLRVPKEQWLFKPGDHVAVVRGESKGQKGIVKACFHEQNEVIVRGVNNYRPDPITLREKVNLTDYVFRNRIERGIYSVEGPMDYHSLRLVDFESGIIEVSPPDAYTDDSSLLREHLRRVLRVCKCRSLDLEILESDENDEMDDVDDGDNDTDARDDDSQVASLRYIVTIEPPKPSTDCEFLPEALSLASLKGGERLDVPDLKSSIGRILRSVRASSSEDSDYEDELDDDDGDEEADDIDLGDDGVKKLNSDDKFEDAQIEDPNASSENLAKSATSDSGQPTQDAKDMTVDAADLPEELPDEAITLKSLFMLGSGEGCPAMWVQVPKRKYKDGQVVAVATGPDKGRVGIVQEHLIHQVLVQFDDDLGNVIKEEQAKNEAAGSPSKAWSRKELREIQAEITEKGDNIQEEDESIRKLPLLYRARFIAELRANVAAASKHNNGNTDSLPDDDPSSSSSSSSQAQALSEANNAQQPSSASPTAVDATEKVYVWTELQPLRFDTGEPERFDYKSINRRRVGRRLLSQCSPDFPFPYIELPNARQRAGRQRMLYGPEEEMFPQPQRSRNEFLDTAYEAAFRRTVDPRTFGMVV